MANAKQCDICKTFYPAHKMSRRALGCDCRDSAGIIIFDTKTEAEDPNNTNMDVTELETCPSCIKAIKDYIEILKVPGV